MSSAALEPPVGSPPSSLVSSSDEFDLFADLRKELQELSAANREILDDLRSDPVLNLETRSEMPVYTAAQWEEREQAYETELAEKTERIRQLEAELEQIRDNGLPELTPEEIHDAAIKRLRSQLEERRRELDADEATLKRQMREMELALAKDRADLARQRADLQRLHSDFQRELEHASRDSNLRDRLMGLQRRHMDSQGKRVSEVELSAPVANRHVQAAPASNKQSSGLFRRLFG